MPDPLDRMAGERRKIANTLFMSQILSKAKHVHLSAMVTTWWLNQA
jgi:hypothetical protein